MAGSLRLRTRSIVSRDQGAERRAIMREPGLPPRATATARTNASQRPTLRPYRRPTGGANGSLNVRRGQAVCVHRNRRTDSRSDGAADRQIRKRAGVSAVEGRRWHRAIRAVRSHRRQAARHLDNSVDHSPAFHDQSRSPQATVPCIRGHRPALLAAPQWSWSDAVRECQICTEFESDPLIARRSRSPVARRLTGVWDVVHDASDRLASLRGLML